MNSATPEVQNETTDDLAAQCWRMMEAVEQRLAARFDAALKQAVQALEQRITAEMNTHLDAIRERLDREILEAELEIEADQEEDDDNTEEE